MTHSLLYFTKKIIIFGSPILLLAILYVVFDPFHVIYGKDQYGSNFLKTYNRNRISTEVFLRNNTEYQFKSFIFGSSRSSAFNTKDWSRILNDPQAFHFDAFNDNISGMAGKVKYVKKQGNKIENALLIIDNDTFSEQYEETESIVHLKDYRWQDTSNVFSYHLTFFKSFFKKQYFISYFDLKLFKEFRPYMDEFFKFKYFYTEISNDFLFPENIEAIKSDSIKYYSNPEFLDRIKNPAAYDKKIKKDHLKDLRIVADIFKNEKTKYKVIISPLFDQRAINPVDLEILKIYFGKENIFDYSGVNKYTEDITNYYELSHYKPELGRVILSEIYQKN